MKDKKFQIFVSSTYTDLKEERQAAVEAILSAGHIPAGMELFSAGDESQMTVIKRWIDESDIYLLILGGRYGSIEPKSGKSYTHLEFEYALEQKKPLFSIVITPEALQSKVKIMGVEAIEQQNQKELDKFKAIVTSNMVEFWNDKKDIQLAIFKTLSDFIYRKELIGWIRGDNNINTALLAEEIAKLTNENSELREKLQSLPSQNKALYFGLEYEQLAEMLKNEKVVYNDSDTNLLDFLSNNGSIFFKGFDSGSEELLNITRLLFDFKIIYDNQKNVKMLGQDFIVHNYLFTEEGHNFYLKVLYLTKTTNIYD
ncbi:hypothetical protein Palpr_2535 [Paludibacter propionicigenes WB4]|uniref:DUF4062 domain-containing protein n=1 Tax=Paludibacter propionicigenes (strain DSM 17365 / JCM 13257 / WB4) TaxID=694427 RepID=E4T7H3_PALPW|nr:DUF4062 domain-containing protein [Paludibacter propionicigenes]ADQ80667.1 hypothetical protein Palpr_2535 [Paludibacter propionicigenes WB4]